MKFFTIKKNKNTKTSKKFPYRIYLVNKRVIPLPSQHDFSSSFVRTHGCSLVGFYMALRFLGVKKNVSWCKSYLDKNMGLHGHAKYSIRQVANAINKIVSGKPAIFYKKITQSNLKSALLNKNMMLFEERDPIHTAVLLYDGKNVIRFSDGKYKKVTLEQEIKKRCGDAYYGGCVVVKSK